MKHSFKKSQKMNIIALLKIIVKKKVRYSAPGNILCVKKAIN